MEYQKQKHPADQKAIINAVALQQAAHFCAGQGATDVKVILGIADDFRNWLNTVSDEPQEVNPANATYPTPTLEQKKVLDEIVKRSGKPVSEVYPKVLEWVKKTYDADQYPQLLSSVSQFLEWADWS